MFVKFLLILDQKAWTRHWKIVYICRRFRSNWIRENYSNAKPNLYQTLFTFYEVSVFRIL